MEPTALPASLYNCTTCDRTVIIPPVDESKPITAQVILTLSQILDSSKLKELADDDFNFDENDEKFSRQVENTVGKGEIACYEQFLFLQQCFQKTCTADL